MKKSYKVYAWAWLSVVSATFITFIVMLLHTSHHDMAEDPNKIEKVVKVDLPDIASCDCEHELAKGSSRWDMYLNHGFFSEPLSKETILKMDNLCQIDAAHWSKYPENGCYVFRDEGGIDGLYYVKCAIYNDRFSCTYEVDKSEGIFVLLLLSFAYTILFYWGVVLVIIALVRKVMNQKNRGEQ